MNHTSALRTRARGFTLVELLVVVTLIAILIALLLPALEGAQEASRRAQCVNNMKQLALATHNYCSAVGTFPWGHGPLRYNDWSWIALSLPYFEQKALYNAINFTYGQAGVGNPLNSTVSLTHLDSLLCCPSDLDRLTTPEGHTNYCGNSGSLAVFFMAGGLNWPQGSQQVFPNGVFLHVPESPSIAAADITDGLSNTAAISEKCKGIGTNNADQADNLTPTTSIALFRTVEQFNIVDPFYLACLSNNPSGAGVTLEEGRPQGTPWHMGNPQACRYNHVMPPNTWSCTNQNSDNGNGAMTASSAHPGGVNIGFCDGSVRLLKDTVNLAVWRALGSRNGGETISADSY